MCQRRQNHERVVDSEQNYEVNPRVFRFNV